MWFPFGQRGLAAMVLSTAVNDFVAPPAAAVLLAAVNDFVAPPATVVLVGFALDGLPSAVVSLRALDWHGFVIMAGASRSIASSTLLCNLEGASIQCSPTCCYLFWPSIALLLHGVWPSNAQLAVLPAGCCLGGIEKEMLRFYASCQLGS
ncbi:hypothetical protein U1Q18_023037 [Sarracenia purpurea var. burkii]